MIFWTALWKLLLVVSLTFFGVMAALVTIGGARDVKQMLSRVEEGHAEKGE